jgi:hypothetical protein
MANESPLRHTICALRGLVPATLAAAAVALTALGKLLPARVVLAVALTAAYPFLLALLGFYLPVERRRLRRLLPLLGR